MDTSFMNFDVKPSALARLSIYDENTAGHNFSLAEATGRNVKTQWKGVIVPMNDHSDKEAVLYTCPRTKRDYRFILHRKNHQKADNYACARCKSRKKYVRILISGEYFLEDPASLNHICYMGAEELRRTRELSNKMKSMELLQERQKIVKRRRIRSIVSTNGVFDLSSISNETPAFPVDAIARLFEESAAPSLAVDIPSTSPTDSATGDEEESQKTDPCAMESVLDNLFNSIPKAEPSDDRASDPEPKEVPDVKRPRCESFAALPSPSNDTDDGSFQISLNRALSGIKPESRAQAENEILRFVYSKLYEKYGI